MDVPEPAEKPAALTRNVKVLSFASLFNDTASEMAYPLLPHLLLQVLKGNHAYLGMIEGIGETIAYLLRLWSGSWADRAARRKSFIVLGYSVPALVRPLLAIITAPWQMFAIRMLDRVGKGIRSAPRDVVITDDTPPEFQGRAFGFQKAMDNLGAAIGPLFATLYLWWRPDHLRDIFLFTIPPAFIVVALVGWGLKETPRAREHVSTPALSLRPFDRQYRVYLLALLVFTLGNASDAFLLVRAGELGVETKWLPILWCVCNLANSISNVTLGKTVDRYGARLCLFLGWMAFAAVYCLLGVVQQLPLIWLLFILYGTVYGIIQPAEKVLVANLVPSDTKGLAFGWQNFVVGVGTLPASLVFGGIYEHFGPIAAFCTGAGLAAVAAIMLLYVTIKPTAVE
jgi:MFS family permease